MQRFTDLEEMPWQAVRPDVAQDVWGKTLLSGDLKLVLTRVPPGGGFSAHTDGYGHLLYFLSGSGLVGVGGEECSVRPGLLVRVAAGEEHHYRNSGHDDLVLVSANIPADSTAA